MLLAAGACDLAWLPGERADIPELMRGMDLFVLPSLREGISNTILEAMASGLPVVATDDPIRREIVGDAGLFVDPTDINAYAATLQKTLDTNWGNKPRKQAAKFSWDLIARKYHQLCQELTS